MAKTVTRGTLRTDLRNRFEIDSIFVTDTEANRMIQVAYNDYYNFVTSINPDHYISSSNVSVVAGTDSYNLPTDFMRVMGVEVLDGARYYPLRSFNWSERNMNVEGDGEKREAMYRVMGSKIYIAPKPQWAGTVRLWYLPAPADFSADNSTMDGISGFEEYVILHALIQYCGKSEEDPTVFASQLGTLKQQMVATLDRDAAEPDRVRDSWAEHGVLFTRRGAYPRLGGA